MATFIRKNASDLDTWDPVLLWYARAVRVMADRPIAHRASWRYQAAVHDYRRSFDPLASNTDVLPGTQEQTRFWSQCQHFSWYFLPWHRMYLGHFEQIVRSVIIAQGGPANWALPYWNYSAGGANGRRLPRAFVEETLPDGSSNMLRIDARFAGNDGAPVGDETNVELTCLTEPRFEADPLGGAVGFGGPKTGFKHARVPGDANRVGSLERTPHGDMHGEVGGWMGAFNTAALDPLFWLHHCNIDRLWEVWRARGGENPSDPDWHTSVSFRFFDAQGSEVVMTPSQVVDPDLSIFDYEYDDISDPLPGSPLAPVPIGELMSDTTGRKIPEMIGATDTGITLAGESATTSMRTVAPEGPAALNAEAANRRIILNIENITGDRSPGYAVYVNLPEGADPAQHRERFAGNLPLFGIESTQDPEQPHADGLHYALDITAMVALLEARGEWDPDRVRLTFVPKTGKNLLSETPPPAVRVGRVSIYSS